MSQQFYHGTLVEYGENIRKTGISKHQLQSRDRGFFGEGFYVTTEYEIAQRHATTVANNLNGEPEILSITVPHISLFRAGDALPDNGNITPQKIPDWHSEFIDWYLNKIEDGAVWETVESASKEGVMSRAEDEMTPTTEDFERLDWYPEVTKFAFDTGYDIIFWSNSEIIINPETTINVE
jgi:hypothetical protein